jgi:RimJ/RimL family protein N-acetyltransferase
MMSSAVEIRPAEPADGEALIAAIEQIDRETAFLAAPGERLAWAERPGPMLAHLHDSGAGVYLIARRDGAILGYLGALAGQYRSTHGVLSIQHVGVRQAARRQSIGSGLLGALERWARARGAHRLDLTVDDTNAPALALYRQHGYVEEGRIREAAHDQGRWCSYIALAKLLGDDASPPLAATSIARRARADSLTVSFKPIGEADAAALRDWEIALLSAPPSLLKQVDEVVDLAGFETALRALAGDPLHDFFAATVIEAGAARIVGVVSVSAKPQARLRGDLAVIVNVLADYRGLGIGRRLFEIGLDRARQRGAHRLSTSLHAANHEALRFATVNGFAPEVVMRRYARVGACHVDLIGLARLLD